MGMWAGSAPLNPTRYRYGWGTAKAVPRSVLSLEMGFEEPQVLVEGAREGSEEISRIDIAGTISLVDRRAYRARDLGVALGQRDQMVRRRIDVGWVGCESGAVGNGLGDADRGSTELDNTFGHRIDVLVQVRPEPVDHFVQRDELRSLDIPMRLLGKERQVDRIGEALVENRDRYALRIRADVVVGFERLHGHASSKTWAVRTIY
jgi:hypothetical protein